MLCVIGDWALRHLEGSPAEQLSTEGSFESGCVLCFDASVLVVSVLSFTRVSAALLVEGVSLALCSHTCNLHETDAHRPLFQLCVLERLPDICSMPGAL